MNDFSALRARPPRATSGRRRDAARALSLLAAEAIGKPISPIRDAAGRVVGASAIARDITERGGLEGEDRAQVLSILTGESRRLQRVLEDFLQYSRPREPRLEVCDLNKTVREILAAAKSDPRLVGETEVKASLDPALPELAFDQNQIRQVLWNVIRNAFQALGGAGRLEVRTEARPGAAAVVVADTGLGLPLHAPAPRSREGVQPLNYR